MKSSYKYIFATLLLSSSTILAGGINYFYHPLILRFISLQEYSEIAFILGIINILGVVCPGIGLFLVQEIKKNPHRERESIYDFISFSVIIGCVGAFIFLLLSPLFIIFLHIEYHLLLIILIGIILISFLSTYQAAYLQVHKYFGYLASLNIIYALGRVLLSVFLVFLGFGVYGAIFGIFLSNIFLFAFGYYFVSSLSKIPIVSSLEIKNLNIFSNPLFKNNKKQILYYISTSFIVALLMNYDIIIMKYFLDPESSGIYGILSVVSKLLFFILLSIESVYYGKLISPILSRRTLSQVVGIYFLFSFGAILCFYFLGENILEMIYPGIGKYNSPLIYLLTSTCFIALSSLFIKLCVGLQKYVLNYVLPIYLCFFLISCSLIGVTSILKFSVLGLIFSLSIFFISLFYLLLSSSYENS